MDLTHHSQAEEGLRRARSDAHAILDAMAQRYRSVRHAGPMTDASRQARACVVSIELFGYGPRAEDAERQALVLAPRIDPKLPLTRGEYAVKLHTVLTGRSL